MSAPDAKRSRWDSDSDPEDSKSRKREVKKPKKAAYKLAADAPAAAPAQNEEAVPVTKPRVEEAVELKPPCRSVTCYEQLNFIDQGTYGMVFRARCRETGKVFALKQVKLSAEASRSGFPITAFREINILLSLRHPSILRVHEMVVGGTVDKVYMVMEYYENDLKAVMKMNRQSFSTAEIKRLMVQLLDAIDYMHGRWVIHRDLKSSNLLYSNKGQLCICDFGLARRYETQPAQPYTFEVVTQWYRCPELLLGIRHYGPALDMWSAGCIFAEMITGEPLFPGQGPIDQLQKIFSLLGAPNESIWPDFARLVSPDNQRKLSWRLPNRSRFREVFPVTAFAGTLALSDQGVHLLSQLLHMDPKQRLTARQALQHPWLTTELPRPTPEDLMPVFKATNES